MAHFEELDPDQRIVLRMAIRRRRSYAAMAEALGTTPEGIRGTALTATDALVPERPAGLADDERARTAEFLLGQQDGAEADATARSLAQDGPAREWALLLQERLSGLGEPAAEIPPVRAGAGAGAGGTSSGRGSARPARPQRPARAPRPPRPDGSGRARPGGRGGGPRAVLGAVAGAGRRATATRRGRGITGGVIAVLLLVVVLAATGVLGGGSGGDEERSTPSRASDAQALAVQFTAAMPQSIPFRAPAGAPAEFANVRGVARPTVSTDDSAVPVLALEITGLPAPTASRRYFVWADRNGSDPVFLGELPAVTGAQLPFQGVDVATRQPVLVDPTVYSRVRVTRETNDAPSAPGPTVIVGTITPPSA